MGSCANTEAGDETPIGGGLVSEAGDEMTVGEGSILHGVVAYTPDGGNDADADLPCGIGFCGTMVQPSADAGDGASDAEAAEVGFPGLVIHPDSATGDQ
jgi:hypothetical protein